LPQADSTGDALPAADPPSTATTTLGGWGKVGNRAAREIKTPVSATLRGDRRFSSLWLRRDEESPERIFARSCPDRPTDRPCDPVDYFFFLPFLAVFFAAFFAAFFLAATRNTSYCRSAQTALGNRTVR
jgi:hypothetical protein